MSEPHGLADIIGKQESNILTGWINEQLATARQGVISEVELKEASRAFLTQFSRAVSSDYTEQLEGPAWDSVRVHLDALSRERVIQGFSASETAGFIFSLKKPLFNALQTAAGADAESLREEFWKLSQVLDRLGLVTVDSYQRERQQVIERQQQELLDLTTPVVKLWDSIVALPLIGTLDSERTQVVMEGLLNAIVENEAAIAIIDITGVPTVDTLVAQHLLKTVAAARLMGAECIISGIRPQIAQTIVHLGVDLGDVVTKATLAEALKIALRRVNLTVSKLGAVRAGD
ncbi:RsbT co-antagonist protein RsbRA [Caballeronia arationis]|uniref:Anti-anti-sigma regulatory factor (Antagonist of anti-sigma factor) n=1 Tax=Caballeronia arationis TaxID=1777142 RepID=A0A7Z7I5G5_9BURK|nr:STAS domain-containing protein [Caballeronia arationis]SAK69447.1 RsbT co-antagonist protein RsbRA [Caballeronia arationis]SOE64720.1 Anti-anti-sigma regulatory factor (antagonist of anti-sigma factor) [Caballeronia arationis]